MRGSKLNCLIWARIPREHLDQCHDDRLRESQPKPRIGWKYAHCHIRGIEAQAWCDDSL